MAAAATILLGVIAHVAGGGGAALDCLPLMAAAVLGVATTHAAQRFAAHTYRGVPAAAALLVVGQAGMHLALSMSLDTHLDSIAAQSGPAPVLVLKLSGGLIVAHAAATALLMILLLGTHQSAELALHVLVHACRAVRTLVAPARPPTWTGLTTVGPCLAREPAALGSEQWRYGPVRPRRGPPSPRGV